MASTRGLQMINPFDPMILIPACLSVVVMVRLFSSLGQTDDSENPPSENTISTSPSTKHVTIGEIITQETNNLDDEQLNDPIEAAIRKIKTIDKAFSKKKFLDGAYIAYETVIMAFAREDYDTLKLILSNTVYKGFIEAINNRSLLGHRMETVIVSMDEAEITEIDTNDEVARISMRFVTKLMISIKDKNGTVVAGNPCKQEEVTDNWTFERLLTSPNPNWILVSTSPG